MRSILAAAALILASSPASADDRVAIPGAGVTLDAPPGWSLADSFSGLQKTSTGSSIVVITLGPETGFAAGIEDVDAKFAEFHERLRSEQNIALEDWRPIVIDGRSGVFAEGEQSTATRKVAKIAYLLRGPEHFTLFSGNILDPEAEATDAAAIHMAVRSAVFTANVAAPELVFDLDPAPGYARDETVSFGPAMGFFRRPAGAPEDRTDDATFVVALDPGEHCVAEALRPGVAMALFQQNSSPSVTMIRGEAGPVTIDGMNGHWIEGMRSDSETGQFAYVRQIVLFDACALWMLRGRAPIADRAADQAAFEAMAQSFRRR